MFVIEFPIFPKARLVANMDYGVSCIYRTCTYLYYAAVRYVVAEWPFDEYDYGPLLIIALGHEKIPSGNVRLREVFRRRRTRKGEKVKYGDIV